VAESPTWRRRLASIGVLLLAAGALIATSPAPPPSSTLDAAFRASPEFPVTTTRINGRMTLELSAAALPGPREDRVRVSGSVTFRALSARIRIAARPLGVVLAGGDYPNRDEPSWSIEALCRVAEPCRREFEVTLTLVDPIPGGTTVADFEADLQIQYSEIDANPDGATASWSASAELGMAHSPRPSVQR
jgi:hypothetical protein